MRNGAAWIGRALVLALSAASLFSCAAPQASPSASPAGTPPVGSLKQTEPPADLGSVERYAWMSVVLLGEAWRDGDVAAFLSRVSRGFYRGYPALESALRENLAGTTGRSVVVAVGGVTAGDEQVSVSTRWERSLVRGGGPPQHLAGETIFLFLRSDTSLRLIDFRGDAPFGIAGIPELP